MGLAEQYTGRQSASRYEQTVAYFKQNYRAYLLIAPASLFLLAVVGYPILETFRLSLYQAPESSTIETYVGLQNYRQIRENDFFYQLLWQTGRWVVVDVALKTSFGLLIAIYLNNNIKGRKFFRTAFLIPWGIPYAISAVIFRWFEHPQYGYLNAILLKLGVIDQSVGILADPSIAWLGVVFADAWI